MSTILPRPKGLIGDLAPEDLNDACCWACSGGGDVLCCDGCRAVYHLTCIGLKQLPEDDFFCPLCQCKSCGKPCRSWAHPSHITTKWVEVKQRPTQPCPQASQPLPSGAGYLCPQQMRNWLQQQLGSSTAAGTFGSRCTPTSNSDKAAADAGDVGVEAHTAEAAAAAQQPKIKRHKEYGSSGTPAPPTGSSSTTAAVRCCCCQSACHITCLPAELKAQYNKCNTPADMQPKSTGKGSKAAKAKQLQQQQQQQQYGQGELQHPEPYFCSRGCRDIATQLAQRCAQGVVQVGSLIDGTPVAWQLIQPAAVAAALEDASTTADAAAAAGAGLPAAAPPSSAKLQPDFPGIPSPSAAAAVGLVGTGVAAGYSAADAAVLAQVLRDTLQLLSQQVGPAWEVRTFQDALPWLVGGLRHNMPAGLLDLSHFHVAVLWVGGTLAAAALVRVHGPAVLEVCLAATQAPLQHKQLGRALMACLERFALETLRVQQAWMPALGGTVKPCAGLSVLPTCERECGARDGLALACTSSVVQLGLTAVQLQSSKVAAAAAAAAGRVSNSSSCSKPGEEDSADAKPQNPKDLKACWALQLHYGPAPSVVDWLQLPKYALMRYSYVPFVTKRLSPETLVPMPSFRKKVRAGPAAAGKAKSEATAVAQAAAGGRLSSAASPAAGKGTNSRTGKRTAAGAAAAATSPQPAKKLLAAAGPRAVQQLPLQQQQQQGLMQPALQQPMLDLPQQQEQQPPECTEQTTKPTTQRQKQQQAVPRPQFKFFSAQQLVDMTRAFNAQQSVAGGIAAGIAAYNSSKSKGGQLMQQQGPRGATGGSAAGRFGVGGVVL